MGLDRSTWLVLLFLVPGVLLPTGCVLWFMNDAATSQAAAARQSVTEAYHNQLPLMRDRVEAYWRARAAELPAPSAANPAASFAQAVKAGAADSIVFLRDKGSPPYPAPIPALHPDAKLPDDLAAARARIRALVKASDKEAALGAIQNQFAAGRFAGSVDSQGRSIAIDEQLLALHLLSRSDPRFASALAHLTARLNDYDHLSLPSAQRLFAMDEVKSIEPAARFPTLEAERLAQQYLENMTVPKDTWKLISQSGRTAALYRTSTVLSAMRTFLDQQSPSRSVRFEMSPPGASIPAESVAAGPLLPGWRIAFLLLDTKPLDEAARARRASYLWAGFLVIGVMSVIGLAAGGIFRRQLRMARLKTDLVAAVSHELKTPLASMRLLVDTLLDDAPLDPVKTREYLHLIAGENQRLTRLIENFLTFSRIERSLQHFDFARVEPKAVIQAAIQAVGERLETPECSVEIATSPYLPALQADADALITVLRNLIDNAWKYTPAAGKRISIRAQREAGHVVFQVSDNGIGIAPREQKRIFRRFYQVDRRLTRETGGCGLGLSIVEFIVKAHGGSVAVESRLGQGSTFTVRIPCGGEPREAAA